MIAVQVSKPKRVWVRYVVASLVGAALGFGTGTGIDAARTYLASDKLTPEDMCRLCLCGADGKGCQCVGAGYVVTLEWQQRYESCGHCALPKCNEPVPAFVLKKK